VNQLWPDAEVVCEDTDAITRLEWLELRRQGLGGSDAAAALGLSPFATPVSLFLDKTDPQPDEDTEWFEWGRRMEGPIAQAFSEKTGIAITYQPVMLRSLKYPFMLANPDRFVDGGILECKNVGAHNAHEWDDGPPLHYRLQGLHYLVVTGLDVVYFAALIGGRRLVIYEVTRDEELIADLVSREEAFWTLVTMNRMPEIDGSETTKQALSAHYDATDQEIEVDGEFLEMVNAYHVAHLEAKIVNERLETIANRIRAAMGDATVATFEGQVTATWKNQTRKSFTTKEATFRKLDVKKVKEA
jgi:putative phage-type endonuclease